jgi:hypothetical protein
LDSLVGQLPRQDDLLHLAPQGPLGREQEGLDHLLGDRRAALGLPPAQHVLDERTQHAPVVEAGVVPVVGILGRHHRVDQHLRELLVRDEGSLLGSQLGDHDAVAIEHATHLLRPVVLQLVDGRQPRIVAVVDEEPHQPGAPQQRSQHGEPEQGSAGPPREPMPGPARAAAASRRLRRRASAPPPRWWFSRRPHTRRHVRSV